MDVTLGKAPRDDMVEAVYGTLERHSVGMEQRCRGWIDFLFEDHGVDG